MRSKGLLTELIIATLLFAVCAICAAALLISSYSTSEKSRKLLEAADLGRAAVEQIQAGHYPDGQSPELTVSVAGQWVAGQPFDGTVEVYDGDRLLLSLPCATSVTVEAMP